MTRNAIESDFWSSKMVAWQPFYEQNKKLSIDLKWREMWFYSCYTCFCCALRSKMIFGIQNGRRQPFYEQNKKLSIDLKWREMRLVMQNGRRQPFCEKQIKVAYCSEMARSAIEIHFRSSKMRGGGGHHNGQPVNHSGIYTVFALGQIHQF